MNVSHPSVLAAAAISALLLMVGCGDDHSPTGNEHLQEAAVEFPAYVPGEIHLRIRGDAEGDYSQSGYFFLDERRGSGPAAERWGGFYSNEDRRDVAVDTLVQLLGWGPLPEGRRTIQPVRPGNSTEGFVFAALSPYLYEHPLSFTLLPFNFHAPDAPLVYLTTDGSYIEFHRVELPEIEPALSRGFGGKVQARLRLRMRGYRPMRTDTGTEFLATSSYIVVLGSLDFPVVRQDFGAGDPGG